MAYQGADGLSVPYPDFVADELAVQPPSNLWRDTAKNILRQRNSIIGLIMVSFLVLIAIFAEVLAPVIICARNHINSVWRVRRNSVKKLLQKIKQFLFPPAGTSRWLRVLPYAVLGVFTLILLTAGAFTWEYTNSPEFCGTSCHTMPPEYTAYLTSPHARIACVDCHIGKGFIATRITRKAGDLRHVVKTAFKSYEFPIRADDLRPARETCELCHFHERFSDDSLRRIRTYGNDKANTPLNKEKE